MKQKTNNKGFFHRMFARKSKAEIIASCIAVPILFLWALTLLIPFFWAFMNTFKTPIEYLTDSFALPTHFDFSNWINAFTKMEVTKSNPIYRANMAEMILHSLWWTFGSVFINQSVTALCAYALAKYRYKFGKALYLFSIIVMAIPIVGSLPAQYSLYHALGIVNSPAMLIVSAGCIGGSNLLIYYSFFANISWSYAEAVFIDGGGHWRAFLYVMLPQAMPIISALSVIGCMAYWNDYFTPLMYLPDFPTLATGLHIMSTSTLTANNKPLYFAAVLWSALPVFVLFLVFQEKIMTSVSIGGLKG